MDALLAGADLLYVAGDGDAHERAYQAVLSAVRRGRVSRAAPARVGAAHPHAQAAVRPARTPAAAGAAAEDDAARANGAPYADDPAGAYGDPAAIAAQRSLTHRGARPRAARRTPYPA